MVSRNFVLATGVQERGGALQKRYVRQESSRRDETVFHSGNQGSRDRNGQLGGIGT